MKFVTPEVRLLASTAIDMKAMYEWLNSMGAVAYEPYDGQISEPELIVGLAAKRCYKSFQVGLNPNITRVRTEWEGYFDNILKSGHGSVLEHANFTFAIENVSRVFTAEMNRHRAGVAISEQSLRYVRFDDIPFVSPPSLDIKDSDPEQLAFNKAETIAIIKACLGNIEYSYKRLVELWDFDNMTDFHQKKIVTSLLRRILPLGIATGAVYTMNGRAIRHICTMRASPEAEEEICLVASMMAKTMCEKYKFLFADFEEIEGGFWVPKYKKV